MKCPLCGSPTAVEGKVQLSADMARRHRRCTNPICPFTTTTYETATDANVVDAIDGVVELVGTIMKNLSPGPRGVFACRLIEIVKCSEKGDDAWG